MASMNNSISMATYSYLSQVYPDGLVQLQMQYDEVESLQSEVLSNSRQPVDFFRTKLIPVRREKTSSLSVNVVDPLDYH